MRESKESNQETENRYKHRRDDYLLKVVEHAHGRQCRENNQTGNQQSSHDTHADDNDDGREDGQKDIVKTGMHAGCFSKRFVKRNRKYPVVKQNEADDDNGGKRKNQI